MKKIRQFLAPLFVLCTSISCLGQYHPELNYAASRVDKDGSYFQLNQVEQDIEVITGYIDLLLEAARKSDQTIPEDFTAQRLARAFGLNELKAVAQSSKYQDKIWTNRTYIETKRNDRGLFSLVGGNGSDYRVTEMTPGGTDLALQVQIDLSQILNIVLESLPETGDLRKDITEEVPETDMSIEDFLKKLNVTLNVAVDLDPKDDVAIGPLKLGRPHVVARVDGVLWAWQLLGDELMTDSEMPFEKSESDGITSYRLPEEMREDLGGYLPMIVVDSKSDQIWIATDPTHMKKCRDGQDKLSTDPAFLATWKGMPEKGNSMFYISKACVTDMQQLYTSLVDEEAFGEDFADSKDLVDQIINDITQCPTGFAMAISKDEKGINIVNKAPIPSWRAQKITELLFELIAQDEEVDE